MIALNLIASGNEQSRIKDYLENNASKSLAEKINQGVKIIKDNISLINKKDLEGFMSYACNEARKLAEKGKNSICVNDEIVFGWAIHYFEEETIEGKLYNEDGTEWIIATPIQEPKSTVKVETVKEKDKQATLFDILNTDSPETYKDDEEITDDEIEDLLTNEEPVEIVDNQQINIQTGEVIKSSIDIKIADNLFKLLDGNLEVK